MAATWTSLARRFAERPAILRPAFSAVPLRGRLPRLAIPPCAPDPDVVLDLPAIFARCYDNGAYAVRVDYNPPPPEPFRTDDEAWADALLRNAGLHGQNHGGDMRPPSGGHPAPEA